MSFPPNVANFIEDIKSYNLWATFRVRAYMFRKKTTDEFKVVVMRVNLLNSSGTSSASESNDQIFMINERNNMENFDQFIADLTISKRMRIIPASAELLTGVWSVDLISPDIALRDFGINFPCMTLTNSGNRIDALNEVEHSFQSQKLGTNTFLNISDACNRLLNLRYMQSTSPNIISIAPIYVKLNLTRLQGSRLDIEIISSSSVAVEDIGVTVYPLNSTGQPTGSIIADLSALRSNGGWNFYGAVVSRNGLGGFAVVLSYKERKIEEKNVFS